MITSRADAGPESPTRGQRRRVFPWVGAALILIVTITAATGIDGDGRLDLTAAVRGLTTGLFGRSDDPTLRYEQIVVWELRMPRVLLAAATGAALAVAGVVMQGLLRNPMVSPFTLGISPAAAFGASLAILGGAAGGRGDIAIVGSALVVGMACASLGLALAGTQRMSPTALILVGLALTYLFSAATSTLQYFASTEELEQIVRWTFGSVNAATWHSAVVVTLVTALVVPLLWWRSGDLDAVAFSGDEVAQTLGVKVGRVRTAGTFLAVLLTAVCVSFTGVIGFVGLVGPHIARLLIGTTHRVLIPFSAVCGATLVILADTIGRAIVAPVVIPVGIVVSFVGAPLFINLILTRRRLFL